jgi:hypothetical protein
MNAHDRTRSAIDIYDKRSLRLKTVESVCYQFTELHGGRFPIDEHQAALFFWIGNEARAARLALRQLSDLVREATTEPNTETFDPERQ